MSKKRKPIPLTRRDFLKYTAALAGTAALPSWLAGCGGESPNSGPPSGLVEWPLITPNDDFYLTHIGVPSPPVNVGSWTLEVGGLVDNPEILTYQDLLGLPTVEETTTLLCIGNRVGGTAVGTATWKGVSFEYLLERWGVQPEAVDLVQRDVLTYSDSVPVSWLQENLAILVTEMNGVELPHIHGYPARIIVPGLYGIKNVKWLGSLEFVDYDFRGFWQNNGNWSESAIVRTLAQIKNIPQNFKMVPGVLPVTGFAFAGLRGIESVEVSADGGETWTYADLGEPISPYTWVDWQTSFLFEQRGEYGIVVRATDGDGVLMVESDTNLLAGSEGWHRIDIEVT